MTQANDIIFSAIHEGDSYSHDYHISSQLYGTFLDAFEDRSPIHVDEDFARKEGFSGRVMHGAILNGFVSHCVGMVFPGKHALLLGVDLRYSNPSYLGDTLHLTIQVLQKLESQSVIECKILIENTTQNHRAASGKALIKVRA